MKRNKRMRSLFIVLILSLFSCNSKNSIEKLPHVKFALDQIDRAEGTMPEIRFKLDSQNLGFEEYQIEVNDDVVIINGGDANGLMYGGLEVAEQLELYGETMPSSGKPYIKKRGIKFNIPLDSRTPSYDDTGDAALNNYAVMWEWDFWQEYLDDLAIHRYNVLTLWNPHPFPSMVKLPNYPEVALEDIYVTKLKPIGVENEWAEPQMVSSNVVENLRLVKKMTIDEKVVFWQKVMQYANDRGIDIYWFNWNICANGAAKPVPPMYRTYNQPLWDEEPGKHGITNQMDNPINLDYYRESVSEFLKTYPQVKGIGVTAGEHMLDTAGSYTREQWIWESYGKGMMEVMQADPARKINFIHRVWNTDMDKIMHYWKDYPGSFEASFKYAKARLYSTPTPDFAKDHICAMNNYGLKSWWNLRNDDVFVYRLGDPEYVRDFINHFDRDHTAGYYMGSDGYVWGREFVSKNPILSGELETKKHWFNFMLWGRLGYNNELSEEFFIKKLQAHYPEVDAPLLYQAWQVASKIIPQVNVYHWNNWDYQWSVEGCIDAREGFHDIERFMTNPTIPGGNYINPAAFGKLNKKTDAIDPMEVAETLEKYASEALALTDSLSEAHTTPEISTLLDDIRAMSYLGKYYSIKIMAAGTLSLYKETGDERFKSFSVGVLKTAVEYWDQYRQISEKNYKPQMLARTKMLDWSAIFKEVKKDVVIAENF